MIPQRIFIRFTHIPGVRTLWSIFPVGSVGLKVKFDIYARPHYAYGLYSAADLAKRLGLTAITAIEFGVAGGRGLVAMQNLAAEIGDSLGVRIFVAGFDTGSGMPEALDYRDLPYVWTKGFYAMDREALKQKLLPETDLVLGDVAQTAPQWVSTSLRAPIGFISFDLDYYSSTKNAFNIFNTDNPAATLPRVFCYFDDIIVPERACHNEYVGELRAIREFNEEHPDRKLCPIHMLRHNRVHQRRWNDQMYVLHDFKHPLYCKNISRLTEEDTEIPL
jgi:hypothetical protein